MTITTNLDRFGPGSGWGVDDDTDEGETMSETQTVTNTCPECNGQGGWYEGYVYVSTEWRACPVCAVSRLRDTIDYLDEFYATPKIDLPYRKVRRVNDALRVIAEHMDF